MSKAILIIDMPEHCYECPLENTKRCPFLWEDVESLDKPKDCPLKPLPHLTDYSQAEDMRAKHSGMYDLNNARNALVRFIDGWESALEEIEGKQK